MLVLWFRASYGLSIEHAEAIDIESNGHDAVARCNIDLPEELQAGEGRLVG